MRGIRPSSLAALLVPAFAVALSACGSTTDSLGYNGTKAEDLGRLDRKTTYPNEFSRLLGKTEAEIDTKINGAWNQLFYGDDNLQRIYYPIDAGSGRDPRHAPRRHPHRRLRLRDDDRGAAGQARRVRSDVGVREIC